MKEGTTSSSPVEISLVSGFSGLSVAVKLWRSHSRGASPTTPISDADAVQGSRRIQKILALHGWLDNAATWDEIAPLLLEATKDGSLDVEVELVCLDLPGHGLSQHRPAGSAYDTASFVSEVFSVLDALGWTRDVILMGHSMGANISSLVASLDPHTPLHPNRITGLITVEGFGTTTAPAESTPKIMLEAMVSHRVLSGRKPNIYPDFPAAVKKLLENNPTLTESSARHLVARATRPLTPEELAAAGGAGTSTAVVFRHDVKLRAGGFYRFVEEQCLALITNIRCPTLVVLGEKGYGPFLKAFPSRKEAIVKAGNIQRIEEVHIPNATHHLHLDTPHAVFPHLRDFIRNPTGQQG